jgi:Fe-Mn family superoxide dismutase
MTEHTTDHALPPLPFPIGALQGISSTTLETHHGRHHKAYVDKLNSLLVGTPLRGKPLEEVIRRSEGALFNNAAQAWNHGFYWNCLTPDRGRAPSPLLLESLVRDFGSFHEFVEKFRASALAKFGSGWTWLALDDEGRLAIENTDDADTPLRHGRTALLTCDVWEHAYYLDFRNERAKYVQVFLEQLNWDFVNVNFAAARPALAIA